MERLEGASLSVDLKDDQTLVEFFWHELVRCMVWFNFECWPPSLLFEEMQKLFKIASILGVGSWRCCCCENKWRKVVAPILGSKNVFQMGAAFGHFFQGLIEISTSDMIICNCKLLNYGLNTLLFQSVICFMNSKHIWHSAAQTHWEGLSWRAWAWSYTSLLVWLLLLLHAFQGRWFGCGPYLQAA